MPSKPSVAEVLAGKDFAGKAVVSFSASTTGSTAVGYVFGPDGGFVKGDTFDHVRIDGLPSGHEEQDATVLESAIASASQSLMGKGGALNGVDVLALGSDNMEHTTVARRGTEKLTNMITWQDTRSGAHEDEFEKIFGHTPGHGLMGPKLLALSRQRDTLALFGDTTVKFDVLASYLPFLATGESFIGPSEQRSQGWTVLPDGTPDPACINQIHANLLGQLPTFLPHDQFCPDGLTAEAAAKWKLPAGIPVAAGLGDNQATYALFPPGTKVISGGTSGTGFVSDEADCPVGTFWSAFQQNFRMLCQQNLGGVGALTVEGIANSRLLGRGDQSGEALAKEVKFVLVLLDQILMEKQGRFGEASALAFLTGERLPMLPKPVSLIRNLSDVIGDSIALYELLMSHLTINLVDGLLADSTFGSGTKEAVLVGGLAKSAWWRKLVASLSGFTCKTLAEPGMGSGQGGVVYLVWLLLKSRGHDFSPQEVSEHMVRYSDDVTEPDEAWAQTYAPARTRYHELLAEVTK